MHDPEGPREARCHVPADGDRTRPQDVADFARDAAMVTRLRMYAQEAGRDPRSLGLERRVHYGDAAAWARIAQEGQDLGGTHLSINTMRAGLSTVRDHIEAIRKFRHWTRGALSA